MRPCTASGACTGTFTFRGSAPSYHSRSAAARTSQSGTPTMRRRIQPAWRARRRRGSAPGRLARTRSAPEATPRRRSGAPRARSRTSDLHHFLLLRRDDLVDLLHAVVRLLLHPVEGLLFFVPGDVAVLLRRLDELLRVAALVADGDLVILALHPALLHDVAAPLLCEGRDRHAHEVLVRLRVEAEVSVPDRLLDRRDHVLLPRLHHDEAGLRDGEGRDLVEGRGGAVIVDAHAVEQVQVRPPGSDVRELAPQVVEGLRDAGVEVGQDVVSGAHARSSPCFWLFSARPTTVPISSPSTTRRTFPRFVESKTMIRRSLYMQRLMAVESITFRFFLRTSM